MFTAHADAERAKERDHFTGRFCALCGGRLLEFTIDFGQHLPAEPIAEATQAAAAADVHLVLGSSLTVSPACDLPAQTASRGGALVIVNLQRTPLDDAAALRIFARTDVVMEGLMARLGRPIPPFTLRRSIVIGGGEVRAVDPDAPGQPVDHLRSVAWAPLGGDPAAQVVAVTPSSPGAAGDTCSPAGAAPGGGIAGCADSSTLATGSSEAAIRPVLSFAGHYSEPPLQLDAPSLPARGAPALRVTVEFEPLVTRQWRPVDAQLHGLSDSADAGAAQRFPDYGASHREYVIDGVVAQAAKAGRELSREQAGAAVDSVFSRKRPVAGAAGGAGVM